MLHPALTFGGNGSQRKTSFYVSLHQFSPIQKQKGNETEMGTEKKHFMFIFMSNACLYGLSFFTTKMRVLRAFSACQHTLPENESKMVD